MVLVAPSDGLDRVGALGMLESGLLAGADGRAVGDHAALQLSLAVKGVKELPFVRVSCFCV